MQLEPIWEDREPMPDFEKEWWDEDDWERFMTIQDKKVDELMRLDELFLNSGLDPHADLELMGFEECDHKCEDCSDRCSCWEYQEKLAKESREARGIPEPEFEHEEPAFKNLPAYKLSFDFAIQVMELLKTIPDKHYDTDEDLYKLAWNCGMAGAKIAGGDGIGYSPDSICGNVANCKRGANAMAASVEALEALSKRPKLTKRALELKELGETALKEIWIRIEELRAEACRLHGEV